MNTQEFIGFLLEKTKLKRVVFPSRDYTDVVRYVWGEASPYQLALSLKRDSYLSHATALFLHGLTDQIPRTIYVNHEQSSKPQSNSLSEESIHKAFSRKPRMSNYVYSYDGWQLTLLSGKSTGRLEVGTLSDPTGQPVDATKLERTLIDIVVRPAYAGGIYQILEAYKAAKERMSVNTLVATLKKLDYLYPYHQAIGFYMQKAGYEEERYMRLRKLGLHYDFYVAHAIPDPTYNSEWRLFTPKDF